MLKKKKTSQTGILKSLSKPTLSITIMSPDATSLNPTLISFGNKFKETWTKDSKLSELKMSTSLCLFLRVIWKKKKNISKDSKQKLPG